MADKKKFKHNESGIKIRILKALGSTRPYGMFKHFAMIKISRCLKRPNAISTDDIWNFLGSTYNIKELDNFHDNELITIRIDFSEILDQYI